MRTSAPPRNLDHGGGHGGYTIVAACMVGPHRTYREVVDHEDHRDTVAIIVDDRVTPFLMQVEVRTTFHIGPWTEATEDLVLQVRGIVDEAWEVSMDR